MILLASLLMLPAAQDSAVGAPPVPCVDERVEGGTRVLVYRGDRTCVDFAERREFGGLWVNEFEGSAWIDGPASIAALPADWREQRVWFSTDAQTRWPGEISRRYGHVYRVRFIGRATRDMNRKPLEGYGHLGVSRGLVLADEILEFTDLGPLPGR